MEKHLHFVILGLSITSSWGNGHATTYRSLVKGLSKNGHKVTFLERDMPWYSKERDLLQFPFCDIILYNSLDELQQNYEALISEADVVIVGSYVPDGVETGKWVQKISQGVTAFYDVDTPVTMSKLEREDYEYISPEIIPGYHLYLSFTGGPVLKMIEDKFGSPMAVPLYCSFDPDIYFPQHNTKIWDLGYMGTYSVDRQSALENLLIKPAGDLPSKRFVIAGPQYPENVKWPSNVKYIHHLPPDQHRKFYNSQRFTLNVTRSDMKLKGYSPSVRLFEAAACATPIISDYWEGIESFFTPGEEIYIAHDSVDVRSVICETREMDRIAVGIKALSKVLLHHTSEHRAKELENYILKIINVKKNVQSLSSTEFNGFQKY